MLLVVSKVSQLDYGELLAHNVTNRSRTRWALPIAGIVQTSSSVSSLVVASSGLLLLLPPFPVLDDTITPTLS